ncbi:2OG-Fe(II) oxygenase family protein [Blastococcus capsensis]|uniref:2OG-Fe(II) oxygenase family protein n=1 Tax=Blastococcus capsensis TaxID=1564163 RepID=UPI00253FD9B8|nr:2OG-Fe(II) oxygenase family protein [Blastococcus capsensis]MDK3257015.1 2OG-Fe(II) oxygenase family protein [Blastococcus capsensis]
MEGTVVDFQAATAAPRFARSLHESGFAVLINHPIADELVATVYEEWLTFFNSEAKHRYPFTPDGQDGYFPIPPEEQIRTGRRDRKEFFHLYPWGQAPAEVSLAAATYRERAMALGRQLLTWLQENSPDDVAARFSRPLPAMLENANPNTLLRILRYPPAPVGEPVGLRAGAHVDTNLLTLLTAATESGLERYSRDGKWVQVPKIGGSIAVNVGLMLELASDGYYPATMHRVSHPAGQAAQRSRMSMALFLHPADDVVLGEAQTAAGLLAERRREEAAGP